MRKRTVYVLVISVLVLVSAALIGWLVVGSNRNGGVQTTANAVRPTVRVAGVRVETIEETSRLTGFVTPKSTVTVISKVPGTVEWLAGEVGTRVMQGEVLARLDDSDLRLQLKQAQAVYDQAQAGLDRLRLGASDEDLRQAAAAVEQAEAGLRLAQESFERARYLYEQGAIPRDAYETAESQYRMARAQLDAARQVLAKAERGALEEELRAAEAQLQQAAVAVELAEKQLSEATIEAPISGTIAVRHTQVGSLIGSGTPVLTLVDIDEVIVEVGVSDRLVNYVAPGQRALVTIPAIPDRVYEGEILAVAPVVDQQTRLYPVRVSVPNPGHLIKPGMMANVDITVQTIEGATTVPSTAVVHKASGPVVYVVHPDGTVEERRVQTGLSWQDRLQVSPLREGELVAISRLSYLTDGISVDIEREEL